MKRFLLTTVAFGMLALPAMAADLTPVYKAPVPVALPTWTGFYVGVNGGYGWSNGAVTETPFQNFASAVPVIPGATGNPKLDGAIFGVHGGYNWQTGAFVLGVEGDWDAAGLNNSAQGVFADPLGTGGTDGLMVHQDVQWLATVRGRLGYTWGSSMVYATGGGAWENLRTNVLLSTDTATGTFATSSATSFTNTRSGYAVGAGYEWMINPNWIARVEYLHYGFSGGGNTFALPVNCGVGGAGATCGGNISGSNNNIDTVRAALSYKFW
jgi:outer membrane immunogenic protein